VTKTLFVGNLSWNTSEEDLGRAVGAHAEVLATRISSDRDTGRSRGFGFVEVPEEQAQAVIDALNGSTLDGREISVNEARPRGDRPSPASRRF
jgi:RNA recognition motif-containing protein